MPDAPHTVELRVGGDVFGGWTSGRVEQSLDNIASTFGLEYVDQWAADSLPWPIEEGDECAILIDDEPLISGYVDETTAEYTARDWTLGVTGRSYLGDMVDCDAVRSGTQWKDVKLSTILGNLLDPFGIDFIIYDDEGAAFRRFKFEPGDLVSDVVAKAARLRGFVMADAGGVLELFRVGNVEPDDHLFRGWPILAASRTGTWAERFSEYRFKGQTQADDELNGTRAACLKGRVEDLQVSRYRPKLVLAGGADGDKDLGARAILERNQRAGRSERITVTVPGFKTEAGNLWRPGMGVHLADDWLRVDATLIVVRVSMEFGPGQVGATEGGMVTELELTRPEAYSESAYPVRARGKSWK